LKRNIFLCIEETLFYPAFLVGQISWHNKMALEKR